ncbi:erythroblast NAD(P)(+)--arginine ADP-ribosyltransferase-like [Eublepharis macularius]|uniref:NAD(P)(+)--arginine ADP-ribosyltransferase n=1 Tax=Eublepharis macularius TaxID=481883 RepID=A0AA97J3I0_EUBMA|nr:erythroblast NAD(P)(+)--arginine ADP-ribosyltransferase-like [Eublepharis macularius]
MGVALLSTEELNLILLEYRDMAQAFSEEEADSLPPYRNTDCAIELIPGERLPKGKLYTMSPAERQELRKFIDKNLERGFIRPASSLHAAPVLFVKKKDGGLRLCTGFRGISAVSMTNAYPIPLIRDLLRVVTQGEVFSFSIERSFSSIREVPFDMATTSFDDQYNGCQDMMEDKVGALLRTEFADTIYAKVWENATAKWDEMKASASVPKDLKPEYAIAALAYTRKEAFLYRDLNRAVRKGESEEYYLRAFHFKAFHFLLRALQVLRANASPKCHETYRGVRGASFIAEPSEKARFGYFASSSLDKDQAMSFGKDTFFTIETCYGGYIKEFSFFPEEEEILIPPFEEFQVAEVTETPDGVHIRLISAGIFSKYNCVYVKDAGLSHLFANVRMPFLFWGFLLIAGALGDPGFL